MDRFALKLRCAVWASGGCKCDLGLAERAGLRGGGFGRFLLVDAGHSRVHHLDEQEYDQSHDQEIDHRSDKFAVIQCDIARDIPRELVEVHAAEQTQNRVDDVIYQRRDKVDLRVQGQPGLQSDFQDSQGYTEKPCLEKKKKRSSSLSLSEPFTYTSGRAS